jgi:hypothetical protein
MFLYIVCCLIGAVIGALIVTLRQGVVRRPDNGVAAENAYLKNRLAVRDAEVEQNRVAASVSGSIPLSNAARDTYLQGQLAEAQRRIEELTISLQTSEESQKRLRERVREFEADTKRTAQFHNSYDVPVGADLAALVPSSRTAHPPLQKAPTAVLLLTHNSPVGEALATFLNGTEFTLQTIAPTTTPPLDENLRALILDLTDGKDRDWQTLRSLSRAKEMKGVPLVALVPDAQRERAMEQGATQAISWPTDSAMVFSVLSSVQIVRNLRADLSARAARLSTMPGTSTADVPLSSSHSPPDAEVSKKARRAA